MSNAIATFNFQSNQLRTIKGADVCAVLELSNPSMVASRLDDDERAKFNLGCQGEATIINESGLDDDEKGVDKIDTLGGSNP